MSKRTSLADGADSKRRDPLEATEDLLASSQAPDLPKGRETERLSVSLLPDERRALEQRLGQLWAQGYVKLGRLSVSRLVRAAIAYLLEADDEDIIQWANRVPDLEKRRGKKET